MKNLLVSTLLLASPLWMAPVSHAQAAAEREPGAPAQDDGGGWLDFDGVALIINGDIVTLRELNKLLSEAKTRAPATTSQDNTELLERVAESAITKQLQTQAGEEMGIPKADVDRTIDRFLADQRRGKGAEETEAWLSAGGAADLGEMRRSVENELYRSFWIESQWGKSAGGARPWRDRYVRPGQLKEAYMVNKEVLGDPTTFRLQFLVLATNAWGDAETAREALEGFREELLGGADMGALVEEYGAALRETRGITDWLPLGGIADPSVRSFCRDASEGAVSDVIEIKGPDGSIQGYQVVRIVARIEGQPAPPFIDGDLQANLAKRLQDSWDNTRLTRASDELWRSAFIRGPVRLQINPPWVQRQRALAARATEVQK